MTKFEQLKERFPNLIPVQELRSSVSIIELAMYYGYSLKPRKGNNRPVLENKVYNDLILIKNAQDAETQVYQRVDNFADSGTIIDFIRNRLSTVFTIFNQADRDEFKNILDVLYDYLRIDPEQTNKIRKATSQLVKPISQSGFALELFDVRPLKKENYLLSRSITQETIDSPEFSHKVVSLITYFDPQKKQVVDFTRMKTESQQDYIEYSNVAFPYYNALSTEVTGLEIRNEKVKLHALGGDRTSSVFVSNPPLQAEHFFIFESAVDALSHKQLRRIHGDNAFNSVYFSTGGQLTPQQVNTIISYVSSFRKAPKWKINLAFDNDTKGHLYDLQFIQQLLTTKFPLRSMAVSLSKIAYTLPNQEVYSDFLKTLLNRIEAYNKTTSVQQLGLSNSDTSKFINLLITIDKGADQIILSIPEQSLPLSFFAKSLLEISQLNNRLVIDKSISKDYNQDLEEKI